MTSNWILVVYKGGLLLVMLVRKDELGSKAFDWVAIMREGLSIRDILLTPDEHENYSPSYR
jgi:hypothetical protein